MKIPRSNNLEGIREYLGLLGRMQLDDRLLGKIDVSGVIQLSLLEAHNANWEHVSEDERLPMLRQIFSNNLLDEIRKFRTERRDVRREQPLDYSLDDTASRLELCLAAVQSTPSQKVVREENALMLAKALAQLPEAQRQAIELHHLKGLELGQISQRMKRTKGAVAALIFRGTTRLRELLHE